MTHDLILSRAGARTPATGAPPPVRNKVVSSLLAISIGAVVLIGLSWFFTAGRRIPLAERDWATDHARVIRTESFPDRVRIHDLRDFDWSAPEGSQENYRTEDFHLADVRRVWFVLAPFAERWRGLAHSFMSFEFTDDRFLAVSVEARRETGENYSLMRGIWRGFETTYVVGTERDLIGQRAIRGDTLFLYPSVATPEQAQALFVDMMSRAESLGQEPEWYHTFLNNCTTALRDHVNRIASDPLPWGWGILMPGYSDALALGHGLLDTDLDIEGARERFRVDSLAREAVNDGDGFGRKIRASMPSSGR